jgi:ribosomal protein L12E/L44/L45/RPP1/RPP2
VLDQTLGQVSAAGLVADEACMSALIAGLTDEDADLILAAGPTDTVTASPEGEAIGQQLVNCVSDPTTATT